MKENATCEGCGSSCGIDSIITEDDHLYCDRACALNSGYRECDNCGQWFKPDCDAIVARDAQLFCSEYCAKMSDYVRCCHCGEWVKEEETHETVDEECVCFSCADKEGYVQCDHCGKWYNPEVADCVYIEDCGNFCSSGCAEQEGFVECSDCEEWVSRDDTWVTYDGRRICDSCYDDNYFTCEECDEIFPESMYMRDGCCRNCVGCNDDWLWGYHDTDTTKGRPLKEGELYLGFELETEPDRDGDANLKEVGETFKSNEFAVKNFTAMEDGSLNYGGVEFISIPKTITEHERDEAEYAKFLQDLSEIGMRSHDAQHCGLHVHMSRSFFSRNQLRVIDAMIIRNKEFWEAVARRRGGCYCEVETGKRLSWVGEPLNGGNHHTALAMGSSDSDSIEFRLFKGTLNPQTLMASLEIMEGLCYFSKTISFMIPWKNPAKSISMFIKFLKDNGYLRAVAYIGSRTHREDCKVKKGGKENA